MSFNLTKVIYIYLLEIIYSSSIKRLKNVASYILPLFFLLSQYFFVMDGEIVADFFAISSPVLYYSIFSESPNTFTAS